MQLANLEVKPPSEPPWSVQEPTFDPEINFKIFKMKGLRRRTEALIFNRKIISLKRGALKVLSFLRHRAI